MAPAHAGEIGSLQLRAVEGPGGAGGALVVARRGQGTRGEEGGLGVPAPAVDEGPGKNVLVVTL